MEDVTDMSSLPNPKTIADLVITDLADEVALKDARIASLEQDNEWARALVVQAVAAVADLTKQRDRLRNQRDDIRAEFAEFRARLLERMTDGIAA